MSRTTITLIISRLLLIATLFFVVLSIGPFAVGEIKLGISCLASAAILNWARSAW